MTIINVSSKAEHHQPPERAILKINVKVEKKDKQEATKLAKISANEVSSILKARSPTSSDGKVLDSAPITWWSMSSLTVSFYNFYFEVGKGEKKEERCAANIGLQAKFKDFEELSNVIGKLNTIPYVEIRSLEWTITDLTRSSLQTNLRTKAIQSAQSQAQDFANALNLNEIECLEIQAGNNNFGDGFGSRAAPVAMMSRSARGGAGGQEEGLDLKPEDVSVSCSLDAKFKATAN